MYIDLPPTTDPMYIYTIALILRCAYIVEIGQLVICVYVKKKSLALHHVAMILCLLEGLTIWRLVYLHKDGNRLLYG